MLSLNRSKLVKWPSLLLEKLSQNSVDLFLRVKRHLILMLRVSVPEKKRISAWYHNAESSFFGAFFVTRNDYTGMKFDTFCWPAISPIIGDVHLAKLNLSFSVSSGRFFREFVLARKHGCHGNNRPHRYG